jgi:hypothetical protein
MAIVAYSSHKIIVVYNTKCAQTTLYSIFGQPWTKNAAYFSGAEGKGDQANLDQFTGLFPDYYVTAWVRNPYSRIVSMYKFNVLRPGAPNKSKVPTFKEWLRGLYIDNDTFYSKLLMQNLFIRNSYDRIDFIGRQENLDNDVKFIADKYDIPFTKPPVKNRSRIHELKWQEFYDDETKSIVAETFKTDIEMFYPDFRLTF